jgi:predicted ArsR family transcriptional regulator
MPQIRRDCLDQLAPEQLQITTTDIADEIGYPASTVRRSLEDLTAHGLVHREHQGEGKANLWQLTTWTRERYSELGIHQNYTPNGDRAHPAQTTPAEGEEAFPF